MALVRLAALADLEAGSGHRVELDDDNAIALFRTDDGVFALVDNCTHEDYPLSEGYVENCQVECSLHGSCFDLRTGKPDVPPAVTPVGTFPVQVRGDDVLVDLPDDLAALAAAL